MRTVESLARVTSGTVCVLKNVEKTFCVVIVEYTIARVF